MPNTDDGIGRLLLEAEPHDGRWNMAFDEALLEAAANRGETTLRIYRWSEATLSLGYFQKSLPENLPEPLRAVPRVRRLSGGGAILHHHEWTYSVALPKSHPLAERTEVLYEAAHGAVIVAFKELGASVALRNESDRAASENFLCFLRGDSHDIVACGRKIVGSAQRRRRGAVLQHGSVVLKHSELAPDVPGLADLIPGVPDEPLWGAAEFARHFGRHLFLAGTPIQESHPDDRKFARQAGCHRDGRATG